MREPGNRAPPPNQANHGELRRDNHHEPTKHTPQPDNHPARKSQPNHSLQPANQEPPTPLQTNQPGSANQSHREQPRLTSTPGAITRQPRGTTTGIAHTQPREPGEHTRRAHARYRTATPAIAKRAPAIEQPTSSQESARQPAAMGTSSHAPGANLPRTLANLARANRGGESKHPPTMKVPEHQVPPTQPRESGERPPAIQQGRGEQLSFCRYYSINNIIT